MSRFADTSYPVILSTAHLFEEGISVPQIDLLILYSFNSTRRESLQRIGRSLHNKDVTPKIFILFYTNTKEEYAKEKIKRIFD